MLKAEEIKKMVQQGVERKPANVWPSYPDGDSLDRSKFVTSSEIGYCERMIKFGKEAMAAGNYSPTEGTVTAEEGEGGWGYFERGHNVEDWLVTTLSRGNAGKYNLVYTGAFQRSFYDRNQSGTPDGIFLVVQEGQAGFYTLEVKSIDPRTNVEKLPKKPHLKQVLQNMDLVAVNLDRKALGAFLVYVDASNYENIYPFTVEFDGQAADELVYRADRIMGAKSAAELEPEGVYTGDCKFCKFTVQCNQVTRSKIASANVKKGTRNDEFIQRAKQLFTKP